jgi:ribosomal protein S18 acetylase RimI-like enzyme
MTTVRPERPEDADALADLHVRAWQRAYAGVFPGELLASLDVAARAARRREVLALPGYPFTSFVAEAGGRIAGFVTFGPYRIDQDASRLDPAYGEILGIYVDPDRWSTGVGSALILAALEQLTQPEVRLWVLEKNEQAHRFYRKHGLSPDGTSALFRPRDSELAFPEIRFSILRGRDEQQG